MKHRKFNLFNYQKPEPENTPTRVTSVSALTRLIKTNLEQSIGCVWVQGEVSNCRRPVSGHLYFTLKDEHSQIRCVFFRSARQRTRCEITDGDRILCYGRVSVYEPRGDYQIILEHAESRGIGALQKAFEKLSARLKAEGLFDSEHKKELPYLPERIGVVTSATGAALKDITSVCRRRARGLELVLRPVRVQGKGAAREIAQAIQAFDRCRDADLLIIGRGGGSLEDLWPFNEEVVARAVFDCGIPIISAVGHEIDLSISDLVADRRALTPTEAAEIAVPDFSEIAQRCGSFRSRLRRGIERHFTDRRNRLDAIQERRMLWSPLRRMQQTQQRLDDLAIRLRQGLLRHSQQYHHKLGLFAEKLDALSPLKILARGYSITSVAGEEKPLKSSDAIRPGDELITRLADGKRICSEFRDVLT